MEFRQNVNAFLAEQLNEQLNATLAKLKDSQDKCSRLQSRLDTSLPELNAIITAAEHKAEEQAARIAELLDRIAVLEESKLMLENLKASMDGSTRATQEQLMDLKLDLDAALARERTLSADLAETRAAYDLYRQEANQLDVIRRKLTAEIETLTADRERLEVQLAAQTHLATTALAEVQKLRASLEDISKLAELTAKELAARQAKAEYLATQYAERLMQYEAQAEAADFTKGEKEKMMKTFELEANKRAHEQEELSNRLASALQDSSTATAVLSQLEMDTKRIMSSPSMSMAEKARAPGASLCFVFFVPIFVYFPLLLAPSLGAKLTPPPSRPSFFRAGAGRGAQEGAQRARGGGRARGRGEAAAGDGDHDLAADAHAAGGQQAGDGVQDRGRGGAEVAAQGARDALYHQGLVREGEAAVGLRREALQGQGRQAGNHGPGTSQAGGAGDLPADGAFCLGVFFPLTAA